MDGLPPLIERFAHTYVLSPESLRVLVLFVEEPERWHDATTVARTLELPRAAARAALDDLARTNLLDMRITGDLRYRFRPGTQELEAQAVALVEAYRRKPAAVLEVLATRTTK